MNQTNNYQLSQWDPEDRILRTDFNSDNAKIDAALEGLKSICNCQLHFQSYIGTGTDGSQTFDFPHAPRFITIIGDNDTWVCGIYGASKTHGRRGANSYFDTPITWLDRAVTFGTSGTNSVFACNTADVNYRVMALLDVSA